VRGRPGASGNVATEFVVRSAPDGYTLMIGAGGNLVVKPGTGAGIRSAE